MHRSNKAAADVLWLLNSALVHTVASDNLPLWLVRLDGCGITLQTRTCIFSTESSTRLLCEAVLCLAILCWNVGRATRSVALSWLNVCCRTPLLPLITPDSPKLGAGYHELWRSSYRNVDTHGSAGPRRGQKLDCLSLSFIDNPNGDVRMSPSIPLRCDF